MVVRRILYVLAALLLINVLPSSAEEYAYFNPSLPEYTHKPEALLSRGRFLVADRGMKDPRFSETVIVLTEYGPLGAAGLIINRPMGIKLRAVLPDVEGLKGRTETVYLGGPVEPHTIFMLIRAKSRPEGAAPVLGDVYVSSEKTLLERLMDDEGSEVRFYAGYAGWSPMQLDNEVSAGGWQVLDAGEEIIFDEPPSEVWSRVIR